jgi:threonine/homoserine/homoserine lactone efflux protein
MGILAILLPLLTSGIQTILDEFGKTGDAAAVGAAEQIALAILQQTATIKGLTIDWTNPQQVLEYIQSLATFVPIPDPATAAPVAPAPAASVKPLTTYNGKPLHAAPSAKG